MNGTPLRPAAAVASSPSPSPSPASLGTFTLVTGNRNKLIEAERILEMKLTCEPLDLPEIQSLDIFEVLRAKGEEALRRLCRPVVVEETGLELAAMGGFPGPLVKWMLDAVGPGGIARTVHALGDPRATARCALIYMDGETERIAEGETRGELVLEPRGEGGFGWDPIFVPEGRSETYAELGSTIKDRLGHRGKAWRRFQLSLNQEAFARSAKGS